VFSKTDAADCDCDGVWTDRPRRPRADCRRHLSRAVALRHIRPGHDRRGTAGDSYYGFISCPGFLEIAGQDGKDIRGSFGLSAEGITSCTSQQPNFCSVPRGAAFCREVSGTLEGEAFSTGSPRAETILYEFRIRIAGQGGRSALGRLTGCDVVGAPEEWFSGGVPNDVSASAFTTVTAECGGYADLQRVDISVRLAAVRR